MKDNIEAYKETCNTIRHYSNSSFNVRVLSIAQGLGLLTAWGLSFEKGNLYILVSISIFGLLFTWLLFRFHMGYFYATTYFFKLASEMEDILFDEGFRPFNAYNKEHEKKYEGIMSKITVLNAPFALIGISFIVTLIISFFR